MPALPGLLLIFGAMSAGLAVVARLGDEDGPGTRGLYGLLIGCWATLAIVYGLLAIGGFHWAIVGAIGLALALAAHRLAPDAGRTVLRAIGAEIVGWSWLAKATAGATGAVVLLTSARAVGRLPFGWDAVTYHLVHAGRWVRDGAFTREHHPDAWAYYEYFPTGGDVLWALFMLGDGTTDYLALALVLGHLLAAVGVYALMRAGGLAGSTAALATSATLASSPFLMTAAWMYVDGLVLAVACATTAATLLAIRRPSTVGAFAVSAGVICAIAIKTNQVLLLGFVPLVLAVRHPRWWVAAVAAAAPVVLLAPEWIDRLFAFGNPLYPFGLPVLGGGEPMLAATMDGTIPLKPDGQAAKTSFSDVVTAAMLVTTPLGAALKAKFPSFVDLPTLVFLLPLAIAQLLRTIRREAAAGLAIVVLLLSSTVFFVLPSNGGLVTTFLPLVARFLLPAWAVVLLLAGGRVGPRVADVALAALTALPLALHLYGQPLDPWSLGIAGLAVIGLVVSHFLPWRHTPLQWLGIAAIGAVGQQAVAMVEAPALPASDQARTTALVYLPRHRPIIEALADAPPGIIATDFAYDNDFVGHDAMRFWLMGRRSQHRLLTISRWHSGALHPQWRPPPPDDTLDAAAWRRRLLASGADWLYVQGPDNPTWQWAASDPAFELIATTESYNALFRVRAAGAEGDARVPALRHRQPQTAKLRRTTNPEP